MTRSTPARLYQLRSKRTSWPAAGRCSMYRWKYHCDCSRSVGWGSAAIRAMRGLRYSVTRLIVLPLPAASRPSNITTTRQPSLRTHSCSFTSSACSRKSSFSYLFLASLAGCPVVSFAEAFLLSLLAIYGTSPLVRWLSGLGRQVAAGSLIICPYWRDIRSPSHLTPRHGMPKGHRPQPDTLEGRRSRPCADCVCAAQPQ